MKKQIKIKPNIIKPERVPAQMPTVQKPGNTGEMDARQRAMAEIARSNYNKVMGRRTGKDYNAYQGEPLTKNMSQIGDAKKSDTVFIVGGGPSLIGFDFNSLANHDTIVVNKAVEYVPDPTYFVTMDYSYLSKTDHWIANYSKQGISTVFVANMTGNLTKKEGVYVDTKFNMRYTKLGEFNYVIESKHIIHQKTGFGKTIGDFAHGDNSGFCAVQLALLLGYEKIYLLGFDMNVGENKNTRTHFHNGYGASSNIRRRIAGYAENFKYAIRLSKDSDKIISCSRDSSLNSYVKFEKYDFIKTQEIKNEPPVEEIVQQDMEHEKIKGLMNLIIVGYYTINTPYQNEAVKLINSCKRLGLNHDIVGVDNLGSWQSNTRYKAKFMADMLLKHPDKRLLYVDCDAVIHRLPDLFRSYSADIAVRFQDFKWRKNECLSGTIYMENNLKTRKLCEIWGKINKSEGPQAKTFEQWNLGAAIEQMAKSDGLVCKNLPPEYTFIFDSMRKMYPKAVPVIEHFQASRKYKHKV